MFDVKILQLDQYIDKVEERADGRLWITTNLNRIYVFSEGSYIRADLRIIK